MEKKYSVSLQYRETRVRFLCHLGSSFDGPTPIKSARFHRKRAPEDRRFSFSSGLIAASQRSSPSPASRSRFLSLSAIVPGGAGLTPASQTETKRADINNLSGRTGFAAATVCVALNMKSNINFCPSCSRPSLILRPITRSRARARNFRVHRNILLAASD